jgi:hypothetical protein
MENELRNAARNGLILRKDEASAHLAEARRHLESAMNEAKGLGPATTQQTMVREDTQSNSLPLDDSIGNRRLLCRHLPWPKHRLVPT